MMSARCSDFWPTSENDAVVFLKSRQFVLRHDLSWIKPAGHILTQREVDAIIYLVQNCSYGGLVPAPVSIDRTAPYEIFPAGGAL